MIKYNYNHFVKIKKKLMKFNHFNYKKNDLILLLPKEILY